MILALYPILLSELDVEEKLRNIQIDDKTLDKMRDLLLSCAIKSSRGNAGHNYEVRDVLENRYVAEIKQALVDTILRDIDSVEAARKYLNYLFLQEEVLVLDKQIKELQLYCEKHPEDEKSFLRLRELSKYRSSVADESDGNSF